MQSVVQLRHKNISCPVMWFDLFCQWLVLDQRYFSPKTITSQKGILNVSICLLGKMIPFLMVLQISAWTQFPSNALRTKLWLSGPRKSLSDFHSPSSSLPTSVNLRMGPLSPSLNPLGSWPLVPPPSTPISSTALSSAGGTSSLNEQTDAHLC